MVTQRQVRLKLTGLDVIWALKSNLTFPVAGIRNVYADPTATRSEGLRFPGTGIPSLIKAGTYVWQGVREFWCIHYTGQSVVFELEDLPFSRVVVDVRDPEAVVQQVRAARYGSGTGV